ncbi:hypothetical protein [Acidipropionibacterium jensenii]|uniref:hypothetical protein n=1 Tax=Acidipropionibacterium jensenii TaxID=1749 RepID=UPI0026479742|nr:hypothetical protein [Acidipropionibacterium jensenii]MDN6762465.1 hypothetical protein [Acidipropionibacterium jensenii]
MAVLLLTSAAGAPGVTSTALGLALWWPREVVLVDADPHPCHAVEAGYLGGRGRAGGGLPELARVHRQGGDLTAALWSQLIDLPRPEDLARSSRPAFSRPVSSRTVSSRTAGTAAVEPIGEGVDRDGDGNSEAARDGGGEPAHLLPGFGHPAQPTHFQAVWPALSTSLVELDQAGVDVIVDLGRAPSGAGGAAGIGLPGDLVARSGLLALVVRAGLRSLAGLSLHRDRIDALVAGTTATVGLVLIGAGHPYSAHEIRRQFGLPVLAEVAEDPRAAAVLSDGVGITSGSLPRGWGRGRYVSSLRHGASVLHRQMARHAGLVDPELLEEPGAGAEEAT